MTGMYLEHYGVLGMKWGVRRYQPYPKGKHGKFLGQSRDEDIRVLKGTKAYRVQTSGKLKNGERAYVSFDSFDNMRYVGLMSLIRENKIGVKMESSEPGLHNLTLELNYDLIAPSYQKTMDTFVETVGKVGVKNVIPKHDSDSPYALDDLAKKGEEFINTYSKDEIWKTRDKAYQLFCETFMQDSKARQIFFDSLKKQGYNAIIDEQDKNFGKRSFTSTPMIVFDADKAFNVTKDVAYTEADMKMFARTFYK